MPECDDIEIVTVWRHYTAACVDCGQEFYRRNQAGPSLCANCEWRRWRDDWIAARDATCHSERGDAGQVTHHAE
ncbi:MAG: hypothetical protein F4169_20910 [Gammaproteobacteria bacterium]|nr:hypothetical protein [Gammaproteobacteria bacterium]